MLRWVVRLIRRVYSSEIWAGWGEVVSDWDGGRDGEWGGGGTMMLVFSSAVMMESWRILSRGVWWDSR